MTRRGGRTFGGEHDTARAAYKCRKENTGIGSQRPQRSHGVHREKDRHELTQML